MKELTAITETWLNSSNKVNQCISEQIPSQKKRILRVDKLTKDLSSLGKKDLVFVKSSADDTKVSIPGVERPWLSEAEGFILPNHDTATKYDSADESSVYSNPLPLLKKLDGVKINEPSSAPAKGNKSPSASKVNSAPADKLKSVKIKDDPPLAIVIKELNDLKLQFSKNQSSYSRNNQQYKRTDHRTCDHAEYISNMNMSWHLKNLGRSSSRSHIPRPSKRFFPPYIHRGCIDHLSDECLYYPFDEKRGTIFNSNKEIVMIAPRVRDVYVLDMTSSAQESCFFAKASENLNWLWPKRLAHLNFKTINKLANKILLLVFPHLNNILVNFYDEKGISQNFCSPYIPEQNGVSKRKNRTLIEVVRTMLLGSVFSEQYWTKGVATACYTKNRSTIVKRHLKTPYEIFYHLGKFDEKADDGYLLGYSLVSKVFRVFNTRRQQTKKTYHITFNESPDAIKFSKFAVDNINIAKNERYPPDEYLHPYEPSQRYQTNSNDVSFIEPYECPELVVLETEVSFDQNGQTNQNDQYVQNDEILNDDHSEHSNHTNDEQIIDKLSNTKDIQISEHSSSPRVKDTSVQNTIPIPNPPLPIPLVVTPAPQDRWSQDNHIELVNITGNPGAGMLIRAIAKELGAASAHECLFVDFLYEEEPKKVFDALQHLGWVDAMQDKLNQFAKNKVWTLVPVPYGKTIIGSKWVFRNKRDETRSVIKIKERLVA
ncbi:retrovirus-related pol polyprotein from transposon TNT 1-94 [Tanacetum coccineum]